MDTTSAPTPYSPSWSTSAPNTITFQAGDIKRDVLVKVSEGVTGCVGEGRTLETWSPNTPSVTSSPTYRYLNFKLWPK